MFTFPRPVETYRIIPPDESYFSHDDDSEIVGHEKRRHVLQRRWSRVSMPTKILIIVILVLGLMVGAGVGMFRLGYSTAARKITQSLRNLQDHHQDEVPIMEASPPTPTIESSQKICSDPARRQEWRSLSQGTKQSCLDAVICLAHTPSVLGQFGTIYDDFPWVHLQMASQTHGNASFLPWHRRFIHLYEQYLQERCGYNGSLPYWDWTLDWESIKDSPLFSPTFGFGGDGDPRLRQTVGGGRCISNGPLAGHLWPLLYGNQTNLHCLSRGFEYGNKPIEALSPGAIDKVLAAKDYRNFLLSLEHGAHSAIPNAVRGDFLSFTAPYDPLSVLHHTQLDRLWLQWQRRDMTGVRFSEYGGSDGSMQGSLEDSLWMGGLEHDGDVVVRDVMDPERGQMCYRYS